MPELLSLTTKSFAALDLRVKLKVARERERERELILTMAKQRETKLCIKKIDGTFIVISEWLLPAKVIQTSWNDVEVNE